LKTTDCLLLEIDRRSKCCFEPTVIDAGNVRSKDRRCMFFTGSEDRIAQLVLTKKRSVDGPDRRLAASSSYAIERTVDRSLGSWVIANRSSKRSHSRSFCSFQYSEPEAATIRSPVPRKPPTVGRMHQSAYESQMIDGVRK
jgi:hypothetical protein